MDSLPLLVEGFAGALTPANLFWVVVGCLLGTAVGVMPGLGSSMAVALLLPMTFALDPTAAFILFAGVYFGGLFGDSTMAILMNTPGQASAIASTFEGHRMALDGRAPQALATAAIGAPQLFEGISLITVTVAILALGEVFHVASRARRDHPDLKTRSAGRPWLKWAEFKEAAPAWGRGTVIGLPFGVIPVGGSEVPTFMAYDVERRLDRRRRFPQFGKGAIRGLAAPEAAGNSTTGMAMGALLALGLPVSATAAIMLAAFRQYGLQPGPLLFDRNPDLVWALLASFFIAMVVLLIIDLPFAQLWSKLLLIRQPYLYAGIAMFCGLGVFATSGRVFDLLLLLGIGLVGFGMRRYGYPLAPLMIGMVLGPLAETSVRDALLSSDGDYAALIDSPITWFIYGLLALVLAFTVRAAVRRKSRQDI